MENTVHIDIRSAVLGFFAGVTLGLLISTCAMGWLVSAESESVEGERLSDLNQLFEDRQTVKEHEGELVLVAETRRSGS